MEDFKNSLFAYALCTSSMTDDIQRTLALPLKRAQKSPAPFKNT